MAMVRLQSQLTADVAMSQPNQISGLKVSDPAILEKLIMLLLDQLVDSFNVKNTFSPVQMFECATLIIERFWYLRPEEILFAFKQAKLGKYGPAYNKIDSQTVLGWIESYDKEDRQAVVERKNASFKSSENEPQIDIMSEYAKQKQMAAETGKTSLHLRDEAKREAEMKRKRGELAYQEYRAGYYESRNQAAENDR